MVFGGVGEEGERGEGGGVRGGREERGGRGWGGCVAWARDGWVGRRTWLPVGTGWEWCARRRDLVLVSSGMTSRQRPGTGPLGGTTRPPARLPLWGSRAGGRGLWRVFRSEFARFWSRGQGGKEPGPREVTTRSCAGRAGWRRGIWRFGTGAWNEECGLAGSRRVDGWVNRRAAGGTRRMSGRSGDRSCANQAKSIGKWVAGLTRIVYPIWGQVASGWWLVVGEGGVDRGLGMRG